MRSRGATHRGVNGTFADGHPFVNMFTFTIFFALPRDVRRNVSLDVIICVVRYSDKYQCSRVARPSRSLLLTTFALDFIFGVFTFTILLAL